MELGEIGEKIASHYLRRKGYKVLERNYRAKIGEMDLILEKDSEIIFCEVKTRQDKKFGEPFEAVTEYKQKRLKRLAEAYCQRKSITDIPLRFDVVSILIGSNKSPEVNHIKNAF